MMPIKKHTVLRTGRNKSRFVQDHKTVSGNVFVSNKLHRLKQPRAMVVKAILLRKVNCW
jgi:hypothetical protein